MRKAEHRAEIDRILMKEAAADRAAPELSPLSRLGLVEISRRRRKPDLTRSLRQACPCCAGEGSLPHPAAAAAQALRALERAARAEPGRRLCLILPISVKAYLEAHPRFDEIRDGSGRRPELREDPARRLGDFEIVAHREPT